MSSFDPTPVVAVASQALADDSLGVRMRASVVDATAGIIEVSIAATAATDARARARVPFGGGRGMSSVSDIDGYPSLRRLAQGFKFKGFAG